MGLAGFNHEQMKKLLKCTVAQSERKEIIKHEIHDLI
jgi:hypothetical protein